MKKSWATCFAILGTASACGINPSDPSPEHVQNQVQASSSCGQWDSYSVNNNEYVVEHDEWNSSVTECLNVNGTDFAITQDNQYLSTGGPPASYPSIYKGCHWGNCTSGSGMPIAANAIGSATSNWNVNLPGSGAYDVAYDIWFNSTPTTSGQPDGTEIMVWINEAGGAQPAGSIVGQMNANGATWNVWYSRMSSWNYVAYQRTSGTESVSLDLLPFFNDSISRGYTQPNWYLIAIEAGFEVWQGGQGLETTSFSANVSTQSQPPPGNQGNIPTGNYQLQAQFSGRCLDDFGFNTNDGAEVGQWDCTGNSNQKWYVNPTGGGWYQLINSNANKCLDVPGASTAQGEYLQLWDCNGTVAQNWKFNDVGNGYYEIVNQGSGLVVDVEGPNPNNGARVHQWGFWNGGNQKFAVLAVR